VLKNKTPMQARAACSLSSDHRWLVTGTPIDSDVDDVHGLLLALQVMTRAPLESTPLNAIYPQGPASARWATTPLHATWQLIQQHILWQSCCARLFVVTLISGCHGACAMAPTSGGVCRYHRMAAIIHDCCHTWTGRCSVTKS
jgi:hypothetical protein